MSRMRARPCIQRLVSRVQVQCLFHHATTAFPPWSGGGSTHTISTNWGGDTNRLDLQVGWASDPGKHLFWKGQSWQWQACNRLCSRHDNAANAFLKPELSSILLPPRNPEDQAQGPNASKQQGQSLNPGLSYSRILGYFLFFFSIYFLLFHYCLFYFFPSPFKEPGLFINTSGFPEYHHFHITF